MLPDITVFGEYTYLVTEVMWGSVALTLLWYAGAFREATRTVAVLYPFAFLWDWYTLEAGVFAIRMRTGVELLGIPVEEHLFMVVVPAMVVGAHESLKKRLDSRPADVRDADVRDTDAATVGKGTDTPTSVRSDGVPEDRPDDGNRSATDPGN